MFAVVKTGGKQYKVAPDDVIKVEKLPVEAGAEVTLDQVLMVGDGDNVTVGAPTVAGATAPPPCWSKRAARRSLSSKNAAAKTRKS